MLIWTDSNVNGVQRVLTFLPDLSCVKQCVLAVAYC